MPDPTPVAPVPTVGADVSNLPRQTRLRRWQSYLFAIAATGLALWFHLAMDARLGGRPALLIFALPIIASAYLGGARAGLLATAIACMGSSYYVLAPAYGIASGSAWERWQLSFLALTGVVISVVSERLGRARHQAHASADRHHAAEASLGTSEARYRKLFEYAPDGIVIADANSYYLDANVRMCQMLGYSREELVGLHASDIVQPSEAQHVAPALAAITNNSAYEREWQFRRKDGSTFPAVVLASMMPDGNLIGMVRDITDRKEAQARIDRLNRLYVVLRGINMLIVRATGMPALFRQVCQVAVDRGGFGLALVGTVDDGRISIAAWCGKDGPYRKGLEGLLNQHPQRASGLQEAAASANAVIVNDIATDPGMALKSEALANGFRSMVVLPIATPGRVVALLGLCAAQAQFFDEDEMTLLLELADDIACALDHIQKTEKLEYLAYYDAVTGLANRTLFLERLAVLMRGPVNGGHHLALILMDIERFKDINGMLGHAGGDVLLKQVAAWLITDVADPSLLARVGPDRYAIVVPEVGQGQMGRFLERTSEAFMAHQFRLGDSELRLGAKFGVACSPGDGIAADILFDNAEAALKKAKTGGTRYLFYKQAMTDSVAENLTIENRLRNALENKEFLLHYQPKQSLENGRLTGAEALLRWVDPCSGLTFPAGFIHILEETGLIHAVGRWALRQALEDYLAWADAGHQVRIAVNISALQLDSSSFKGEIEQLIAEDPRAAAGLELELTEGMVMRDIDRSIDSLRAIRAMGISVAVDDFGTGFSSLNYLSKMPIDTLKIDRSFVSAMIDSERGVALVSTIINLAHSLQLNVVAEGVETEEQAALLRSLGCEEAQGYLYGKPLPRAMFEAAHLS